MQLKDVNLRQVYRNWKNNAGTLEAFIRSGPFVSLQTYENFELDLTIDIENLLRIHKDITPQIANSDRDEFVILDLDFDRCTEIAFILNNIQGIKPIISFNMLFNTNGLIGSRENIQNLIKYGQNLNNIKSEKYAIFTNYERYFDFSEEEHKRKLNNQYEVCEDDLPYADTLITLGYKKAKLITKEKVKEDMENYLEHLTSSGIAVQITEEV